MESPFARAEALERAKQSLQSSLETAINEHQQGLRRPLELDLSFDEGTSERGALSDADDSIAAQVRALVEAFHMDPAVTATGVRAKHVTALDSDGDGQAVVRVRFVYPDEG